jgi:EAL domain-containing protein (putative c-di-GMP-specific phosphodiesterase class I)
VRVAIDDFGTGYSCLSYLRRFPLRVLKIDRSFVSDLATSVDAQAICAAILSIAHSLSLDVVAEGIESEQQLAFLTKHGCHFGQGYYFGRPVGPHEIAALMTDRGSLTARHRRIALQPQIATAG